LRKYPTNRTEYAKKVGKTRVDNICNALRSFGFEVKTYDIESDGVDIEVYKNGRCILVIEVTNWRISSYLDSKRAKSIKNNLRNYPEQYKLVVFSFEENYKNKKDFFTDLKVDFLVFGFQTQPESYYAFFDKQGEATSMLPDNEETKNLVIKLIHDYLEEKDLI